MNPPPMKCPQCGELMVCTIDESLGRSYWCGFCLHEEPVPFDKPGDRKDWIYEPKGDRLPNEDKTGGANR